MDLERLPAGLRPHAAQLQAAWRRLAERERLALQVAGAVFVLVLGVLLFVNPALKTLREAPQQLARLDAELARMQSWAAEAERLRGQSPVNRAQAEAALQAATELLGAEARLIVQGERATLNFSNLGADKLAAWLAEARSAARARAIEANLQRGPRGYGGSIVLSLSSGPAS